MIIFHLYSQSLQINFTVIFKPANTLFVNKIKQQNRYKIQ